MQLRKKAMLTAEVLGVLLGDTALLGLFAGLDFVGLSWTWLFVGLFRPFAGLFFFGLFFFGLLSSTELPRAVTRSSVCVCLLGLVPAPFRPLRALKGPSISDGS